MNAVEDAIEKATEPANDNVTPLLHTAANDYPAATQKGFKILLGKDGSVGLWRFPAGEVERLVSGGIWITGLARDTDALGWCNVVEYIDQDSNRRTWLMPKGLLAGDKVEVIRHLLERGLFVASSIKAKNDLFEYVSNGSDERFVTVEHTGWHEGNFVLPDGVISAGDQHSKYMLLNPKPVSPKQGTLESWRDTVASRCAGNSRLVLAVSAAFAAPLLHVAGIEGGCIHYVGESSTGKTKALKAASTVFGVTVHSWRTTANGLEATAAEHSDIGLLLDEIGQVNAKEAGEAVYMLGNGSGKVRARRDGTGKPAVSFRVITQTTGEKSLSEHMATIGRKTMAGQEVRILDIEADAGKGMGLFECIHAEPTPQAFADSLDDLVLQHRGLAGPAFVKYIVDNRDTCEKAIREVSRLFNEANALQKASGQVQRAAKRFALIAAAGELATEAGITGWGQAEALRAAEACFSAWLNSWSPSGSREAQKAVEQVRGFLQLHSARFIADGNPNPPNCAGYKQASEYWIYPKVFTDEVCNEFRGKTVTGALGEHGCLVTANDGKTSCRRRAGGKRQRFYVVSDSIFAEDDGA